jgi:hypothetical protein
MRVERAKQIYDEKYRTLLEPNQSGRFVAVEPDSGEHFVADTFDAAVEAARKVYPTRLPHIIRVGHAAALHIGGISS